MKKFTLSAAMLLLMGCGPAETPPVSEPEQTIPKTVGPVVTVHCTLKDNETGRVTKGTYFTYDTRTKDMPSAAMFKGGGYHHTQKERDIFKERLSSYRLTGGAVVLPIKQRKNKYRLDHENIWYSHGNSWHFYEPQGKFKFTTTCCGIVGFGERRKGEDAFEGQFDFLKGGPQGGVSGTWSYHGLGAITEEAYQWGYLQCGIDPDKLDGTYIRGGPE